MSNQENRLKAVDELGNEHPRGRIIIKHNGKVHTIFSDCEYHRTPATVERTRVLVIEGMEYELTSVFDTAPASTPSEKLLSYIDILSEKDR